MGNDSAECVSRAAWYVGTAEGPAIFCRAASVVAVVLACQKLIEPALRGRANERVDNQNNSTINGFIYRFAAH